MKTVQLLADGPETTIAADGDGGKNLEISCVVRGNKETIAFTGI